MTAEILEPRRRPTQERSHKKFDHLLQVSRELLQDSEAVQLGHLDIEEQQVWFRLAHEIKGLAAVR